MTNGPELTELELVKNELTMITGPRIDLSAVKQRCQGELKYSTE